MSLGSDKDDEGPKCKSQKVLDCFKNEELLFCGKLLIENGSF